LVNHSLISLQIRTRYRPSQPQRLFGSCLRPPGSWQKRGHTRVRATLVGSEIIAETEFKHFSHVNDFKTMDSDLVQFIDLVIAEQVLFAVHLPLLQFDDYTDRALTYPSCFSVTGHPFSFPLDAVIFTPVESVAILTFPLPPPFLSLSQYGCHASNPLPLQPPSLASRSRSVHVCTLLILIRHPSSIIHYPLSIIHYP
jgi:hypothetical protein